MLFEPKLHYRTMRGEVPEGEHVVELGKARLAREGTDVSLVAYGSMVPLCEQVADELAGECSCEVLDIRTLKPLDEDALLATAAKTGRVVVVQEAPRTAGYGAELAAVLAEKAMLDLRGPVLRVTGYDVPYPYWQIEDAYMPSVRARLERRPEAARVLSGVVTERVRLWLERAGAGYRLRDAATEQVVREDDPRIHVIPVAGVSYRLDEVQAEGVRTRDGRSRSCRSRTTSTTRTRSRSGTRSGACRPATSPRRWRATLRADEWQAVSLREFAEEGRRGGLRVLARSARRVDRDAALVIHELPLERRTLHGHYSRELPPIVSIDPGDTIAFSCPNAGWEYERGVRFEPYDEELDAGHALVGPVEVRGAKAGGTLVVRVGSVVPGPWGVTLAHEPTRIEWRLEERLGSRIAACKRRRSRRSSA